MDYSYSYSAQDEAALGALMGAAAVYYVLALIFAIVILVAMWKLFAKAGKPGWAAIIPIYNYYVLFDIVYGNGIKFLLLLVPFLNIAVSIGLYIRMAQVYGKSVGFGIGMLFFPYVCLPILAFGNSAYQGPVDSFI